MELTPAREGVGNLPVGWRPTTVDGIASRTRNAIVGGPFGSDLVCSDYVAEGIPVIRGANMRGQWVSGPFVFVTQAKGQSLEANLARPGDLVFTQRGTLGQVCLVPDSGFDVYLVSQSQMKVSVDSATADPRFVFQVFSSDLHQSLIRASAIQTGLPHLNLGILRRMPLQLPSLPEQRAIATVLSDADALIESLEQLLVKKRLIKQGMMQQLLTGKRRLPGFARPWGKVRLHELGRFLKGQGVRRDKSQSGNLPCVRYGELYTSHTDYIKGFHSWISSEVAASATPIRCGDILFAGSGETKAEIGKCAALVDEVEAYAGGDILILRTQIGDPLFLGFLLNMPQVTRQKAARGQGDAVVHIKASALAEIELVIPDPDEQAAIAGILRDMDSELMAIEAKLAKARLIKQGMMQNLLTGKIRLV